MKRFVIPMLAMFALAACGDDKEEKALSGMKGYKDKMCACEKDKDPKACTEKVHSDKDQWEEKLAESFKGEPSKSFQEKWEKVEDEYRACRDKFRGE